MGGGGGVQVTSFAGVMSTFIRGSLKRQQGNRLSATCAAALKMKSRILKCRLHVDRVWVGRCGGCDT